MMQMKGEEASVNSPWPVPPLPLPAKKRKRLEFQMAKRLGSQTAEQKKHIEKNMDFIIEMIYCEFVFKRYDWTSVDWGEILHMLHHCREIYLNEDELKELVIRLSNDTITFIYLLGLPGYNWDNVSNAVTCNSETWDSIAWDPKPDKKFRRRGLSKYSELVAMFTRTNSPGGSDVETTFPNKAGVDKGKRAAITNVAATPSTPPPRRLNLPM